MKFAALALLMLTAVLHRTSALETQTSSEQGCLNRYALVIYPFKNDVAAAIRAAFETQFGSESRFCLIAFSSLSLQLQQEALSKKGIAQPKEWGKKTNADYLVTGEVFNGGSETQVQFIDLRSGVSVFNKVVSSSTPRCFVSVQCNVPVAQQMLREVLDQFPLQARVTDIRSAEVAGHFRLSLDRGSAQGVSLNLSGRLVNALGQTTPMVRLVSLDANSSVAELITDVVPPWVKAGTEVRLGLPETLPEAARGLWQVSSATFTFPLEVLANGRSVQEMESVSEGQRVSLRFKAPLEGYPVVISITSGDRSINLLLPNEFDPSPRKLKQGEAFSYPPSNAPWGWVTDGADELQFKVLILPTLPRWATSGNEDITSQAQQIRETLGALKTNWASAGFVWTTVH